MSENQLETLNMSTGELKVGLQAAWEKAYAANDTEACALLERFIGYADNVEQTVIVQAAIEHRLYQVLMQYKHQIASLEDQRDVAYNEGYQDAMRAVTDHEQPTVQRYQSSAHFPGVEARH